MNFGATVVFWPYRLPPAIQILIGSYKICSFTHTLMKSNFYMSSFAWLYFSMFISFGQTKPEGNDHYQPVAVINQATGVLPAKTDVIIGNDRLVTIGMCLSANFQNIIQALLTKQN